MNELSLPPKVTKAKANHKTPELGQNLTLFTVPHPPKKKKKRRKRGKHLVVTPKTVKVAHGSPECVANSFCPFHQSRQKLLQLAICLPLSAKCSLSFSSIYMFLCVCTIFHVFSFNVYALPCLQNIVKVFTSNKKAQNK